MNIDHENDIMNARNNVVRHCHMVTAAADAFRWEDQKYVNARIVELEQAIDDYRVTVQKERVTA
jgi:hypothetical protein